MSSLDLDTAGFETISLRNGPLRFTALAAGDPANHRGTVLLLHGFPDTAHSFRNQLLALADAGYRAIAPMMRGYEPGSQPADGDYSLPALCSDVVAWLDELDVPTVHLVGHDWGAAVAYVVGAAHPERFTTITALAIPPLTRIPGALRHVPRQLLLSWYMTWFQLPVIAERSVSAKRLWLLERLWRRWSPGLDLDTVDWERVRAAFEQPGVVAGALGYYRQNATPLILLGVRRTAAMENSVVAAPTLIVNGTADGCMDRRLFVHTIDEADFPAGVTHVELEGVGHFLQLERPGEIADLILGHIDSSA